MSMYPVPSTQRQGITSGACTASPVDRCAAKWHRRSDANPRGFCRADRMCPARPPVYRALSSNTFCPSFWSRRPCLPPLIATDGIAVRCAAPTAILCRPSKGNCPPGRRCSARRLFLPYARPARPREQSCRFSSCRTHPDRAPQSIHPRARRLLPPFSFPRGDLKSRRCSKNATRAERKREMFYSCEPWSRLLILPVFSNRPST